MLPTRTVQAAVARRSMRGLLETPRPLSAEQLRDTMPEGLERLLGEQDTELLLEGGTPEGMRRLMGLAWKTPASLLDYLPPETTVVIDERRHGKAHGQQWLDHVEDHHREMATEAGLWGGRGSSALSSVPKRAKEARVAERVSPLLGFPWALVT